MKIAMVSEHASPLALLGSEDSGGQNVHVAELARGLARRGVEVVVHTRRDDPALPRRVAFAPGVVVDHVLAGPPQPLPKDSLFAHMAAFADDLADTWRRDRPDVVHSHFWMSGLAALDAGRRTGLPVLHTYHALGEEKRRQQGAADTSPDERIGVEQRIAMDADRLLATTRCEARTLEDMGATPERIAVVPCGVDVTRFCPAERRTDRSRPAPPGRIKVVAAGRLVRRKGLGEVIEALGRVPEADLVVAGGPPAGFVMDDDEARRLRQLAREVGVADRVCFLGAVARGDMADLLRAADVVACCPWYEPFGMVALEAMACGVPVLATAVGGLAETVVDGVTGIHVTPRQPASIAAGLRRLLDDTLRRDLGRAGAERARRYSWDHVAAQTNAVAAVTMTAGRGIGEPR